MILNILVILLYLFGSSLLVTNLVKSGLKRLDPISIDKIPSLFLISLFGGFLGLISVIGVQRGLPELEIMNFVLILFGSFLLGLAYTDYTTQWVPLIAQIPFALCLGVIFWSCLTPSFPEFIQGGLFGLTFLGLAHLFWTAQALVGFKILPPMDLVGLVAPLAIFGINSISLVFYGLLIGLLAVLMFFKPIPIGGRGYGFSEFQVGNGNEFPALSILFPLILAFLITVPWLP